MEILVGDKSPEIEKSGISPIRGHEEIGGTRTGLQAGRQPFSVHLR